MKKEDILIIGSGMGGLVCGTMLSREGYRVTIVERNKQIGGSLQIYVHDKVIFDAGVHYLGGLDKGQNLYQIFKWLGLLDKLKLEKMDQDFDRIIIEGDEKEYKIRQGYEAFAQQMILDFPGEKTAIQKYIKEVVDTCDRFPMYRLQMRGDLNVKEEAMGVSAKLFIDSLTENKTLRAVLAGNNMLYAGSGDQTPFYMHALTVNSYMESAWRCLDGGSQIAKILAQIIQAEGGRIIKNREVKKLVVEDGRVTSALLDNGTSIGAAYFISNTSPANTYRMVESGMIRPVTRNRIEEMPTTVSSFILNIVFKTDRISYKKHNYYYHAKESVWEMDNYTEMNWPLGYAMYFIPSFSNPGYAAGLTIFAYMRYEEVKEWSSSFNTVSKKRERGKEYEQFKIKKAEKLLSRVEEKFPGLRKSIKHYYTATPLTFRDYIGNDDGNLYGAMKDYKNPLATLFSPKTKIPNLFLTGQYLNLHGILGTAISGLITSAALMGKEDFIEKIRNA